MDDGHERLLIMDGKHWKLPEQSEDKPIFFTDVDSDGTVDAAGDVCAHFGKIIMFLCL